eukprot:TRINITY_DN1139_c0_g1_i1.p1 TRINITY_DN1139_c0_g1~~TRINITY_DN1139_c0_g1_i1.p1  ORF type:complete len:141 (+),score=21.33 TRINITY_DN1139_c0_g1_i1:222-644(+)
MQLHAGYNISVEVNDSHCGMLSKEICPNTENITVNTTIPCYVDDGCDVDFEEPSVNTALTINAIIVMVIVAVFLCECVRELRKDYRELWKRRKQAQQERRERQHRLREASFNLLALNNENNTVEMMLHASTGSTHLDMME